MTMWIEKVVGGLAEKKKYREYRERIGRLPAGYREAGAALERYLLHLGPTGDGENLLVMLTDLVDLLEQSAAAGTPVRDVVGVDPAEFAEAFMQNYGGGSWVRKERSRLAAAIDEAEEKEQR